MSTISPKGSLVTELPKVDSINLMVCKAYEYWVTCYCSGQLTGDSTFSDWLLEESGLNIKSGDAGSWAVVNEDQFLLFLLKWS